MHRCALQSEFDAFLSTRIFPKNLGTSVKFDLVSVSYLSLSCASACFTLHVQLGLGWDVFQNGWDGSQPFHRFNSCISAF